MRQKDKIPIRFIKCKVECKSPNIVGSRVFNKLPCYVTEYPTLFNKKLNDFMVNNIIP